MENLKTVVIWDSFDASLQYFVVEGRDISHLNNKYVNDARNTQKLNKEISALMYDQVTGQKIIATAKEFPIAAVLAGAKVISCGFLP